MSELKKSLRLEPISTKIAKKILDKYHPLGYGVGASLAVGVFWKDKCEGVLIFGIPVSNIAVQKYGLRQKDVLELRKMWISDVPPINSESRALAIVAKLIKKHYSSVRLLITYCESSEKAAAYRASGWRTVASYRYASKVSYHGKLITIRDFNRLGGQKIHGRRIVTKYMNKQKLLYPLDAAVAQLLERLSSRQKVEGVNPIQPLQIHAANNEETGIGNNPSLPDIGTGRTSGTGD